MRNVAGFIVRVVLVALVLIVGIATVVAVRSVGIVPDKYFWPIAVVWGLLSVATAYGIFRIGKSRMVWSVLSGIGAVMIVASAVPIIGTAMKFNVALDSIRVPEAIVNNDGVVEMPGESVLGTFVLYISGIDARTHDLPDRAQSDVNIIVVVNPTTHKILTVTTPRDFYVENAKPWL